MAGYNPQVAACTWETMARHPLFPSLTSRDAERVAAWSEELTEFLRYMRSQQAALEKVNADSLARHQELQSLPHAMLTDLELGYSPAEVMDRARRRYNISDQYARLAIAHARRTVKQRAKRRRDLLIVRLAGRGWSDERIGRRVGTSKRTVARTLKRYLKPGEPI